MAAVIELKYFNAFTMKKIKAIAQVEPSEGEIISISGSILIAENGSGAALTKAQCNVGQEVFFEYVDGFGANRTYRGNITAMSIVGNTNEVTLSAAVPDWVAAQLG